MAPFGGDTDKNKSNQLKKKDEYDSKENLWSCILSEVQAQGNTKLPTNKSVLVLGDNGSGKTTLVAKLQGVEDPTKGSGLEYAYIDVRDEYRDDSTRLGVWVLDGDPGHLNLLNFALPKENYPHTLVMLVASMTSPCTIMDQLEMWSDKLHKHLKSLNIDPDVEKECRQKCAKKWQEYSEAAEEGPKRASKALDEEDLLPLPDNVLTTNYGVDIIVCITKTDYMSMLEKEYDYREEHFDFIQYHLRNFCMSHGADLFYTSAKEDKNLDLLYKYLTHRIYGLGSAPPALVVEKDAVLVPAGWDQANKIAILTESMHSFKPDQPYNEVITVPKGSRKSATKEVELQAEDEQSFLTKQLNQLQAGRTDAVKMSPGVQKTSERRLAGSSGMQSNISVVSSKKPDGIKPGIPGSGEGVLANFFNSLLNKKSPGNVPGAIKTGTDATVSNADKAAMRSDAAAELERLSRAKKSDSNSSDC
ncbi:Cytoplasmic dynein 1 light intermediate chain, putative [Pediculus humanus corporis]|uniref:Dynein light intermediate chain n=1 Tax=Pediculus humanus subsp. corporis TaxID=121224 RepID=E0VJT5_PEDHC|nr:Cytoplasmic dynein 1 light intermediate chain, putative [Pediculus humanus corporis]EEB13641.1 Cytoplasmic dynein 1 light intermediate chain, putative [Pediculus humanus corporis]